jgi:uncharacterized membrane protein YphA (DoxX/SURF4 family)
MYMCSVFSAQIEGFPMRFRDQVALTLPALVLRLVLAVVFLWAGIGKFASTTTVSGDDAARLNNIGVTLTAVQAPTIEPELPINSLPDTDLEEEPDLTIEPILENSDDEQRLQEILDEARRRAEQAKESSEQEPDELPVQAPPVDPEAQPEDQPEAESLGLDNASFSMINTQLSGSKTTASDFPDPMQVRRVYIVSLLLNKCADPGLTSESQPITPILPSRLASGSWARYLAIAAALTECVAGFLLLIGFMTRFSALGTLSVMLVALWTTQFGPAAIQSSDAIIGFIPNHGDFWDATSYLNLFLQLALAAMSIAVFFLGAGPVSLDRVIFGASKRDKYIHGDPKAAPQASTRDPFDRSPNPTP